jgi:hypothetical protein
VRRLPLAAIVLLGCGHQARPWDQGDAEAPPPPPPPSVASTQASGTAEGPAADDAGKPDEPDAPTPPVRIGGPWVRCYGGFHPTGDPVKDVTRLSILCGPENGMKRLSKRPIEGAVAAGGPGVSETFEARRGECYRVFAVAEPAVADLDVVVRSSRGAPVAADHGEDSWPIVQPDRPFCPLADDRYTVEISARRGAGRFAAEVWALRTPSKR